MSEESSTNKLSNEGDLSSNLKEVSKPVDISTSGSHLHAKYKLISREFSRIYDAKIDKHITHWWQNYIYIWKGLKKNLNLALAIHLGKQHLRGNRNYAES